jgi:predicted transcriptional regulator
MVNLVQMEHTFSTSDLSDSSNQSHEVSPHATVTGEGAAILSDPYRAVYVYAFIGQERTATAVAQELNIKLSTLLYQIKCLIRAGLIRVTRLERRGGSSIKYYRATADAFYVPLEHTTAESLEVLINRWNQSLQAVYLKGFAHALLSASPQWGLRISRSAAGQLMISPATTPERDWDFFAPESPVLLEGWFTDLRLNLADAKAFQADLIGLYLKYLGREGAQRYIIKVAVAPMADAQEIPPQW